jgi:CubicO group peptidase (beta-lactamase class C family)
MQTEETTPQDSGEEDAERANDTAGPAITQAEVAAFATFLKEIRAEYQIPGLAAAIVQSDETIFAEGFGVRNVETGEPVTPETLFHIGSTQKSMTAMLIATLVDDGYLDWDTPLVEIDPDFELSDPDATKQVTIRHLLSMSSGIPDDAEEEFDIENSTAEDVFTLVTETPLLGQPGEVFSYSNPSSALAGYMGVLAAGGEFGKLYNGYAQLIQERILDPIGMDTATLSVEEVRANPNLSSSHIFDEDEQVIVAESYDFTGDPLAPSGSLKASVLDMARYMSTQVSRGVAPNGKHVVSEENLTATWQPHISEDGNENSSYAMGWSVTEQAGVEVIWHDGSYDSFNSTLVFVPATRTGLVILTNLDEVGDSLDIIRMEFVKIVK